jgi:O-antigen ligase
MPSGVSDTTRRSTVDAWQVLTILLLIIAVMAPLVVVSGMFFPYVVPRNILFRVAVELATSLVVIRIAIGRARLDLCSEHILTALSAFVAAMTISALVSPAMNHSLFGDFERMGGVWAWLHLLLFFFLLRTLDELYLHIVLYAAAAVSVAVAVHAILGSCFTIAAPLTIIGNPGLLGGYLLMAIAICLWLARPPERSWWLVSGPIAILYGALLLAGNRSSVMGLAVGGLAGAVFIGFRGRGSRRWIPLLLVAGVAAATIGLAAVGGKNRSGCVLGTAPTVLHRIAATNFQGADAARTIQWNAALAGFLDRPIVGYGPENHHLVWAAHFDPRSEKLGAEVFDRVHNQFLEILATTGLIGTATFLALWITIGYALYRAYSQRLLTVYAVAVLGAANLAYAAYLTFWFVDINAVMLWLLIVAIAALRFAAQPVLHPHRRAAGKPAAAAGIVVTALVLMWALYAHAYIPIRASFALATLDSYAGDRESAAAAVRTIAASAAPQTSHNATILAHYINTLSSRGELRTADSNSDLAFRTAIAEFEAELERDPLNDRLHSQYAAFLLAAYDFYGDEKYLERAVTMVTRAIDLNPGRTQHRRLLERIESSRPT